MKRSFADILAGLDDDRARKVARKLPEWAAIDGQRREAGLDALEFPSALALEQCSSTATARYKASLAASCGTAAGTASGNRATLGTVRGRGPSSDGRGRAKRDVSGGSCPLPGAEAGMTVLDLTGGLGVDSWAFSQVAERVEYYERDAELAAAAGRNFAKLGVGNIEVHCETVTPDTELPEADLIYADPARRDAAGRKVFLLEDCTPDILTLLPMLLRKAPAVLLKLSPMADLTMLTGRLGPTLREIHVVELDGEVKELLCLLSGPLSAEPDIVVTRLSGQAAASAPRSGQLPPETSRFARPLPSGDRPLPLTMPRVARFPEAVPAAVPQQSADDLLTFRLSEEQQAQAMYAAEVRPGEVLLEPCPALLKAGAFRLPCARWGLRKLAPSTHLYLLPEDAAWHLSAAKSASADRPAPGLCGSKVGKGLEAAGGFGGYAPVFNAPDNPFFKARRVSDVLPLGAAAFKELKRRYPKAEITARNLPLTTDALRKKMGIAPGGDTHIFGCTLANGSAVLLVCDPIS